MILTEADLTMISERSRLNSDIFALIESHRELLAANALLSFESNIHKIREAMNA
jgi:hypothetical protein